MCKRLFSALSRTFLVSLALRILRQQTPSWLLVRDQCGMERAFRARVVDPLFTIRVRASLESTTGHEYGTRGP